MIPESTPVKTAVRLRAHFHPDYPDRALMPVGALFVSLIMITYEHDIPVDRLFRMQGFYWSWLGSAVITYAVLHVAAVNVRTLDTNWPWTYKPWQRLWRQGVYGVVLPLMIALSFSYVYFYIRGVPFRIHDYFDQDIVLVLAMLVLLNLAYYQYFRKRYQQAYGYKFKWGYEPAVYDDIEGEVVEEVELLAIGSEAVEEADYPGMVYEYDNIAFFKSEEGATYSYAVDQSKTIVDATVNELLSGLDADQYFMIRRGIVVHRGAIRTAEAVGRRYRIFMNDPYQDEEFYTSKSQSVAFRKWYFGDDGVSGE